MKITEAHVQEAVVQMLVLDGWRSFRTDPVSDVKRGKGFGEVGMPDYLFIRYVGATAAAMARDVAAIESATMIGSIYNLAEVLWCEFKAPGKVPSPHQLAWHEAERARGALVMVFDSIESARTWYKGSGLMRHPILS